jgi:sugar O-acyltransferase (sialic acid O-acetyltransferase NeuD family)
MQDVKKIIILGTGGNSIDILDTISDINSVTNSGVLECVGLLDDNKELWNTSLHGVTILGPLSAAREFQDCCFVNGIGSSSNFWKKEAIIAQTGIPLERFETIIHPSASVSRTAQIDFGTVIFQNVTITSNVTIGNHVIVLPNSVISHDDSVGDYTCIATGVCISGGVRVGHSCYLGANATVIENVELGDYCLVGMGSVVLRDVPANSVVVGNPSYLLRNTR